MRVGHAICLDTIDRLLGVMLAIHSSDAGRHVAMPRRQA